MEKLCSGYGQWHSPNNSRNPQEYFGITISDISQMVEEPPSVPKEKAQWAIGSNLFSRVHNDQRKRGAFLFLWSDIDDTQGLTFNEIIERVADFLEADFMAYTSRSATKDHQKSRIIVPLLEPIPGEKFVIYQKILNDKLEAAGITPDRATERAGQICYLPNRGEFYKSFQFNTFGLLNPTLFVEEEKISKKEKVKHEQSSDNGTDVQRYNDTHSLAMVLERYGYTLRGKKWLSPNSQSGVPGLTITEDGQKWLSAHESDSGIGRATKNGTMGDAFDLFVYYQHGGNFTAALKAIASNAETCNGSFQRHDMGDKRKKGPKGLALDKLKNQYDSEVSWVWRKHFPFGLPVIVNGREGLGKTTICLKAAKEILEQYIQGNVLWLATEGAVQDTVSKMVEQGLTNDRFMVAQKSNETFKFDLVLQSDQKELETLMDNLRPILCVFIDSIRGMSRLDDNDPKNGDLIHKINSIVCDKHRAGLVYIDHHGKGQKSNLLDKAVGTTAKTSSVRGVLSVMPFSKFKRIIKPAKANISTMGGELEVLKVGNEIIIQEPVTHSEESLKDRAEEFLINLFSQNSSMKARDVYSMGEDEGFSGSLLKVVKKDLGIESTRDGRDSPWKWMWPIYSVPNDSNNSKGVSY